MPDPIFLSNQSTNWLSLDGMEQVLYEFSHLVVPPKDTDPLLRKGPQVLSVFDPARVPNANMRLPGVTAKRHAIRSAEKSPSGGVYITNELVWLVNASQFPSIVSENIPGKPKPADVIVDTEQIRWTVQTTRYAPATKNYHLACIALALALDLRETISIERPGISYDPAGSPIKAFPSGPGPRGGEVLYANLAVRMQLESDEVRDERGIRAFVGKYNVTVEKEIAITNEDRILWRPQTGGGYYLDIIGYHNAQRTDELPVVDAELRP